MPKKCSGHGRPSRYSSYASANPEVKKTASRESYAANPEPKRAAKLATYAANAEERKQASRDSYAANPELKKAAKRANYAANAEERKPASQDSYCANPEPKRAAMCANYAANAEELKQASRDSYAANPESKKASTRANYEANPEQRKACSRKQYSMNPNAKRLASRILYAKSRAQKTKSCSEYYKERQSLLCSNRRNWYRLTKPKRRVKDLYANVTQRNLVLDNKARIEVVKVVRKSFPIVVKRNLVSRIACGYAARRLVNKSLRVRKEHAGNLLKVIREITRLSIKGARTSSGAWADSVANGFISETKAATGLQQRPAERPMPLQHAAANSRLQQ